MFKAALNMGEDMPFPPRKSPAIPRSPAPSNAAPRAGEEPAISTTLPPISSIKSPISIFSPNHDFLPATSNALRAPFTSVLPFNLL